MALSPLLTVGAGLLGPALGLGTPAQAAPLGAPCDPPVSNPVACENTLPGNPKTEWDVPNGGGRRHDPGLRHRHQRQQGRRRSTSRSRPTPAPTASTSTAWATTAATGREGRRPSRRRHAAAEPAGLLTDAATGLIDCGNWAVSASWAVPANAVSGHLHRQAGAARHRRGEPHRLRRARRRQRLGPRLPDLGHHLAGLQRLRRQQPLHAAAPAGRAYKVSYNRPFTTRERPARAPDWLFNAEYPMVRWLEANGYDVCYTTGVDTDRRGARAAGAQGLPSVGHDEYWSGEQRANVEAARDAGVNLAFFSGNEVFWKTRWENSIDGTNTPTAPWSPTRRPRPTPRSTPVPAWTGTWRDPRFSPPADGGRPENALTGTIFMVNGRRNDAHRRSRRPTGKLRFWRNTSVATLTAGRRRRSPTATLGYEWDEDLDNGSRPAGLIRLSTTTGTNAAVPAGLRLHATARDGHPPPDPLPRTPAGRWSSAPAPSSGPGASTPTHDGRRHPPADVRMQQATVNLLADMGVQPGRCRPAWSPATASTDATPPTSTITSPAAGASLPVGDAGDHHRHGDRQPAGVVGGVEVSVDGGATWHPATGRRSWTYTWTPTARAAVTITSRAVDDSGNLETPGAGVTVTVGRRSLPVQPLATRRRPGLAADAGRRRRRAGGASSAPTPRRRSPASASTRARNTGTHVGSLWTGERARCWPAPPSPTRRPPAGSRSTSPARWRSPPARPTSPPTTPPTGATRRDDGYFAAAAASTGRPCTPRQTARAGATGSTPTARRGPSPTRPSERQLLGGRRLRLPGRPAEPPPRRSATPTQTPPRRRRRRRPCPGRRRHPAHPYRNAAPPAGRLHGHLRRPPGPEPVPERAVPGGGDRLGQRAVVPLRPLGGPHHQERLLRRPRPDQRHLHLRHPPAPGQHEGLQRGRRARAR